jgi:transposase
VRYCNPERGISTGPNSPPKGRMKKISDGVRERVLSLLRSGISTRNVARQAGASQSSVSRIRRQYMPALPPNKAGRPKALTPRQAREIARLASSGKALTAVEIQRHLQISELATVSFGIVRDSLRRSGLRARVRRRAPLLRPVHRRKRLTFAKKYRDWTREDWRRVIWSDETKINLLGSDGRSYCWRAPGGPTLAHHFQPTLKHGSGSIFLWGCMTAKGVGFMAKIDGGLDAHMYTQILAGEMLQTLEWYGMERDEITFQHDNDPKHTAIRTKIWLLESGLRVLDWPAQSPDLNPIEHLWAELKKRVRNRERPPTTLEELWNAIEEEWEGIPPDFCLKLIDTMPARISDVLKTKGGNTTW